ncbi:hypothetical protein Sjap_000275 [Stephania japonica]|uniref:Uncharacterized protein n=1 Tax=Stephania japonica TaxID=461633 RepID=A0AAP0KIN8_9MAGN
MEEILAIGRARTSSAGPRQATQNRNTEVEGPGTGPSKHGGGSVSFATTQERLADSSETPPSVNDLYLHLHTVNHDRRHSSILDRAAPERTSSRPTCATPEQSVDDEAVYLNVADAGCGAAGEFDVIAEQLRKVMNFMHQRLGMDMDEIGLAQQQPPPPPPPPPPHDQQQPPQIDPADPPQQGDNVGRETTPGLGGRRGGYSGGSELGGGYGGFGASGLGAYRGAYSLVVALRWRFRNASKLRFTY